MLDFQPTEVRAYDPDGQYLRTITGPGEGPGEITEANGILLSGDTLLWIHDHGKWMIIGVDPAGEEVRRFNKPVMSYTYIWDGVFDNRGRYLKRTFHRDGGFTYPPPPGLSSSTSRRYYIGRTGESGDTLVVIEAGLPVQRVTAEDRSAYVEGTLENWPGLRREAEEVAALMPDVKPILAGMFVDDEGRLWVERVTPSEAPAFYDRYSEDGDYLGSIRLGFRPARGRFWVQKGSIYTWVTDEMGVPFIVRAPFS